MIRITIINDTKSRLFCKVYAGPEALLKDEHTFFIILFKQRPFRDGTELKVFELKPNDDVSWVTPLPDIRIYLSTKKGYACIGATHNDDENHKILIIKDANDPDLKNVEIPTENKPLLN